MHDLSLSIYACVVPSRRTNYLFIYLYHLSCYGNVLLRDIVVLVL